MKHRILNDAMNEISDIHIAQAAKPQRKVRPLWMGITAAVLAAAVGLLAVFRPATVQAEGLLVAPVYPEMVAFSEDNWSAWSDSQQAQYDQPDGYADSAEAFFRSSIPVILNSETGNQVYAPVNVYMALSMLAETTDGSSRQQLLELLGADSIEALRTQANHVWNAHYADNGLAACVLANSLWLDSTLSYDQSTVDTLAQEYFASVYQGDLGSQKMNTTLRDWLNDQTHGLLQEQTQGVELDPMCILALASTVYYNVQWEDDFYEGNNYEATFHTPQGDTDTTFMYKVLSYGPYYQGSSCGAVTLSLRDGSRMWLFLPEEGYTPAQLLESGQITDMLYGEDLESADVQVNLSLPKFDIVSNTDLIPQLQQLGVTDVFGVQADFSPLLGSTDAAPYVDQISHAARVAVDEKGVTAAAYTLIEVDGAGMASAEEIDFTLDRPFVFVIESRDGLPLFTGIVNQP